MKKGKKGAVYTIQADYLFGIYPRLKFNKNLLPLRVGNYYSNGVNNNGPEMSALLAAKDSLIQYLKDEASYLRDENVNLLEEIRNLRRRDAVAVAPSLRRKIVNWVAGFWQRDS